MGDSKKERESVKCVSVGIAAAAGLPSSASADDEWDAVSSFLPLTILLNEMKQTSVKKRVNSVKSIPSIAIALGPAKSRALLIPFLAQLMVEEEEIQKEVLRLMPGLVSLIGGPYHAHILLDIVFESLMKVGTAENSVKETAVNVAKDLFRGIDLRHFQKLLMDFIDRVLEKDSFRAKETVVTIMPEIFMSLSSENQSEILEMLRKLSQDQNPMVRKIVAGTLRDFVKLIPPAPEGVLLSILDRLLEDEHDYVRMPLLESVILCSQVCVEKSLAEFEAILATIVADQSVKVRSNLLEYAGIIKKTFSEDIFKRLIVPTYLAALDIEAENDLKVKSLINIVEISRHVHDFPTTFFPKLKLLAKDQSFSVKYEGGRTNVLMIDRKGRTSVMRL